MNRMSGSSSPLEDLRSGGDVVVCVFDCAGENTGEMLGETLM
jgi:hypothetical protein